jgi:hypothetical protein
MQNHYVFLRGSSQADYSNGDITVTTAELYVATDGTLDHLQNIDIRESYEI